MNVHKHTNRLIHESSPYLNQHAHNPVDWYPWCEEAIARAKAEDKPIFLSIGYSACHWCHVMERESFQNEEIARFMNANFINIKVDREERVDLDELYMAAVQLMSGTGGWPMSVWLTPDLEPFYGGTYFPPYDRGGMPGFLRVLKMVHDVYRNDRDRVTSRATKITERLREIYAPSARPEKGGLDESTIDKAVQQYLESHDDRYGGFGGAPKFPPAQQILLLLRQYRRTGDERILNMVETTLDCMANGGIHDQLGGGFHRYSTDVRWLIPHFEKMLYDNALLAHAYTDAYLVTRKERYRSVAEGILDYVLREMTAREGGFFATQDADSEGEEGRYYVWTQEQVKRILGERDAAVFNRFYGILPQGNFDHGTTVLHVPHQPQDVAMRAGMTCAELEELLAAGRTKLFEVRSRRIPPSRDEKIIASWNGLMISAFSRGGRVFDDPRYRDAAVQAAEFLRNRLYVEGRLYRSHRDGRVRHRGYLEDYAFVANAMLDLYEATFDSRWLEWGVELVEGMLEHFGDPKSGVLYLTSHDHERLLARARDSHDGAMPAGASVAVLTMFRLARFCGREDLTERAMAVIESYAEAIGRMPTAFPSMLSALDFHLAPPMEIAVVGADGDPSADLLRRLVNGRYLPNAVIAGTLVNGASRRRRKTETVVFLRGKQPVDGKAAVYICENYACTEPVTDPDALTSVIADRFRVD